MGQVLSDLSYNKKALQFIGRPVDDLKALYQDKKEDYKYAIETFNATETALNQVPFHPDDIEIVNTAKLKFKDTLAEFTDKGDFENRVLDSTTLANDLANKYGLLDVQRIAKEQAGYQKVLKNRLTKGDITSQQYQNAVRDSERNYKGLQKDPTTGAYIGTYNGTQVQNYVNVSEEVMKVLKGFKANEIILKDSKGRAIVRNNDGTGYMTTGTREFVSEAELVRAAKAHMEASPEIQSQFKEDTYFELQNLLHDEQGNKRELTSRDITRLINSSNSEGAMKTLGINAGNIGNLEETLKDKDLEEVFKFIKNDQLVNEALRLGVDKESYDKYKESYLKDWQLADTLKNDRESSFTGQYGTLHSFHTSDNVTSKDLERSSKFYKQGTESIEQLTAEISNMEKEGGFPEDIKRKKQDLREQQRIVDNINQRMESVLDITPEIREEARGSVNIVNRDRFTSTNTRKSIYSSTEEGKSEPLTSSFDINAGSLDRLIFKSIASPLAPEDLEGFINVDLGLSYAEYLKDNLSAADVTALTSQFPEYVNEELGEQNINRIDYAGLKDKVYNTLKEKGEEGLKELNLPEETKLGMKDSYDAHIKNSQFHAANRINQSARDLKKKSENKEINYTEEFKVFNLPDMKAEDARRNPVHQLNKLASDLPSLDSNYNTQLTSTLNNLDVKTHIEEAYDVEDEDGEILWDKGTISSSLDSMINIENGEYSPVLVLQIPIKDGKNSTKTIQVPVHYNEPTYSAIYREALSSYSDGLNRKRDTKGLSSSQQQTLDRVNTNLFNTSPYAKDFDLLNLHTAKNREVVPFEFWDGYDSQIQVFENASPQDLSYYLVQTEKSIDGDDVIKYYATDREGKQTLVTEQELANNEGLTALGASTPKDLKIIYSNMIFNNGLDKSSKSQEESQEFRVELKDTVDLTDIFNSDVKEGVNPRIHKDIESKVVALKTLYPDLIITDALRPNETEVGVEDSLHKDAKALDLRLNQESRNLVNMSEDTKQRLGIKNVSIHNNNHVHIEFN